MRRMLPALMAFMAEPATIEMAARMYRRLYEALIREGFQTSEALMITAAQRSFHNANITGGGA